MRPLCPFALFIPLMVALRPAIAQTSATHEPIATRQNVFSIPYTVDPPQPGEAPPSEVQLLVSGNRGVSWDLYQRQHATAKRFHFRAGGDGEYWFAVRTVGPNGGGVTAPGSPIAELQVVVDTVQPRLELTAGVGASGEVQARWSMTDDYLDPATLELEYQTDKQPQWHRIALSARPGINNSHRSTATGETTWWPRSAERVVNIRATVRDRAGNSTTVTRRLELPPDVEQFQANGTPSLAPDSFATYPQTSASTQGTADGSIPWAPDSAHRDPTMPGNDGNSARRNWMTEETASNDRHLKEASQYSNAVTRGDRDDRDVQSGSERPEVPNLSDSPFRQVGARTGPPAAEDDSLIGRTNSASDSRRTSTSRRFHLDYEIEKGPPGQLGRVELWYTTNHGRTWLHYGNDEDKLSPFLVEVDREGLYGFRLILHSAEGLSARPPRSGDTADIWVHADWTRPVVRLTSARYGSGSQFGELDIRWEASDDYLVQRPVTLSYRPTSGDSWTTIADELLNTGQHTWRVDDGVPDEFYLRIDVRDLAGNVATDQVTEPISSTGLVPRGRIRNMRPAHDANRDTGAANR